VTQTTKATVTQAAPLQVRVDGAATATPATRLASYAPVVGHRVRVIVDAGTLLVIGQEV